MSEPYDFGYGTISWDDINGENAKLVEAEYRERFQGTIKGWEDIDKKAQFVLSGLIALITGVVGLAFTQAENIETQYLLGLLVLATILIIAAASAATSLYPRPYVHSGFTPPDLNVAKWIPLLKGSEKEAVRLCGVRIKELARGIYQNESSNATKSRWLRYSIIATVAAFPATLISVTVTHWVVGFSNAPSTTNIAPIYLAVCTPSIALRTPVVALVIVAALLLGVASGGLLGWFWVINHRKLPHA